MLHRLLVTGGRDYSDWSRVCCVLSNLNPHVVIHGGARGADALSAKWARENNRIDWAFFPNWDALGKRAGMVRNAEMLALSFPTIAVAFPGGKGTAHMVSCIERAGIPLLKVAI